MLQFIIWGILVVYLNYMAALFASNRAKRIPDKPLPDILHDILPQINNYVPDYLLLLCIIYIMIYRLDVVSLSDVTRLLGCLTLRPMFICMTTFPTCCVKPVNDDVYSKLFLNTHDLMFSGHTCLFLFFGHIIKGALGYGIVQFLFPLTLVASRNHYTIDVVVAMLVYSHV